MRQPVSTHTFMLPFIWNASGKKKGNASLEKFEKVLLAHSELHWIRKQYRKPGQKLTEKEIENNFNEYSYFHDHVALPIHDVESADESTMHYYEVDLLPNAKDDGSETEKERYYEIQIQNKKEPELYRLDIAGISLHAYATSVAILTIQLNNYSHKEPKDILKINEFGRRLYPQFVSSPGEGSLDRSIISFTKDAFLAGSISICINGGDPTVEDFSAYEDHSKLREWNMASGALWVPAYIRYLLGPNFQFAIDAMPSEGIILCEKCLDDRMFFLSWYGEDLLSEWEPSAKDKESDHEELGYQNEPFWYAYLFGDKSGTWADITSPNDRFRREEVTNATYDRWYRTDKNKERTLFGITRWSFVCLSSSPLIGHHVNTMYYQMVVLCLAQRASIIAFRKELARLSKRMNSSKGKISKTVQEEINQMFDRYIDFENQMVFEEVTSQIQGIELYEMLQKAMQIDVALEALDKKTQQLNRYILDLNQQVENRYTKRLGILGALILIPSLIAGILGMNTVPDWDKVMLFEGKMHPAFRDSLLLIAFSALLTIIALIVINKTRSKK